MRRHVERLVARRRSAGDAWGGPQVLGRLACSAEVWVSSEGGIQREKVGRLGWAGAFRTGRQPGAWGLWRASKRVMGEARNAGPQRFKLEKPCRLCRKYRRAVFGIGLYRYSTRRRQA